MLAVSGLSDDLLRADICSTLDRRRFIFTIVNTGEGGEYHPQAKTNSDGIPKRVVRAGFSVAGKAAKSLIAERPL